MKNNNHNNNSNNGPYEPCLMLLVVHRTLSLVIKFSESEWIKLEGLVILTNELRIREEKAK